MALLLMMASHKALVEVYHFVGETRHLTLTHDRAAERACGVDVVIKGAYARFPCPDRKLIMSSREPVDTVELG